MLRDFLISAAAGLACFATLHAAEPEAAPPQRVELPPLHTSIYVGSVKLRTEPFLRSGDSLTYNSKYQATVVPWVFWNEAGDIALTIPEETMTHFLAGETVEVSGKATNRKGKTREISARLQPGNGGSGKIKIRIRAGDTQLIFNGPYAIKSTGTDTGS